jgi:hypothetical protein
MFEDHWIHSVHNHERWNYAVETRYIYGYQNALGGRLGHPGEGNGGANLFDSSSYKWFSSGTEMTCCLLNTYSAVGYLAGLLLLEPLELLLSESQLRLGSTPTSRKCRGGCKGSVADPEVGGRD